MALAEEVGLANSFIGEGRVKGEEWLAKRVETEAAKATAKRSWDGMGFSPGTKHRLNRDDGSNDAFFFGARTLMCLWEIVLRFALSPGREFYA